MRARIIKSVSSASNHMNIIEDLETIANGEPWRIRARLNEYTAKLRQERAEEVETGHQAPRRTAQQNKALWLAFEHAAKALNEAGYTVQLVLKERTIDIDWTKDTIHDLLWLPTQQAIFGTGSTTQLAKIGDIDTIADHLNRHLSEKFGVSFLIPSYETRPDEAPLIGDRTHR